MGSRQRQRPRLHSLSDDLELAVPLSVEIWNLGIPSFSSSASEKETTANDNQQDEDHLDDDDDGVLSGAGTSARWYQLLQHESSILDQVDLQVLVREQEPKLEKNDGFDEVETARLDENERANYPREILLYEGKNDNGYTAQPCWNHLQEKLSGNSDWINLHRDTYESLEFRFRRNHPYGNSSLEQQPFFLTALVHPSQLQSLGNTSSGSHSGTNLLKLVPALPVNLLVVHFSDQSTRILPQHFQLLSRHHPQLFVEQRLEETSRNGRQSSLVNRRPPPQEQKQRSNQRNHGDRVNKDRSELKDGKAAAGSPIFRDDAFRALDKVEAINKKPLSNNLVDDALAFGAALSLIEESTEEMNENDQSGEDDSDPPLSTEDQAQMEELLREREMLLRLVERERQALERETDELRVIQARVQNSLNLQKELEEQTRQLQEETEKERREVRKLRLLLEAHRLRLIRGLETCFPVVYKSVPTPPATATTASTMGSFLMSNGGSAVGALASTNSAVPGLTLRDWSLPPSGSLFTGGLTDDEISAALGVLSQVVLLLAKYLEVPLRYRIFSNSSRSAIQDDRGIIHPLFLARPVEREQVEQGLALLERNVMCIIQSRGIPLPPLPTTAETLDLQQSTSGHVFEKVRRIYQATAQGLSLAQL